MNITQTPQRSPCVKYIPALIQNSTLFSMLHQRTMTLPEMFEVQGFPVFVPPECPYVCPFRDAMVEVDQGNFHFKQPPATLRSMAGNGMHVQCVGHALLFILGCTKPVCHRGRFLRFLTPEECFGMEQTAEGPSTDVEDS